MPQVNIPDSLFQEVEKALPKAVSPDEFVAMAVREKLTLEDQKKEFFRLSDLTRAAMSEKGLSESDVLTDFESIRQALHG